VYTITVNHDNWKAPLGIVYDPSKAENNTEVTVGSKKLPAMTCSGISDAVAKGLSAVFGKAG
jgi:hypothetical protein